MSAFTNNVAVITGGNSGIGLATAREFSPVVEDSPGTAPHAVRGPGYHARQGWFGRTVTDR